MLSLLFIHKYKISFHQALFVFNHMIVPMLCYGSEIQLSICKKFLSISTSVSNAAVLGDLMHSVLDIISVYA